MHPTLFEFETPSFLSGLFPDIISIHSYGLMIALGAVTAFLYLWKQMNKRFGTTFDEAQTLFIILLVASVVGGKIFIIFERPGYYFSHPEQLLENFGSGFVFYGSLIFAIPSLLGFLYWKKIPIWQGLDQIAIAGAIVHLFGRSGCFLAGCCYGLPTNSITGITFTHPDSVAPLHTSIHPTQLYSMTLIFIILLVLLRLSKNKRFDGQVFLTYILIYSVGRGAIELFRGDIARGYVIEGYLSNSQLISLILLAVVTTLYYYQYKKVLNES